MPVTASFFKKASFSVEYANTVLYSMDRRCRELIRYSCFTGLICNSLLSLSIIQLSKPERSQSSVAQHGVPAETGTGSDSKRRRGERRSPRDLQPPASVSARGTEHHPALLTPASSPGHTGGCYWHVPAPRSSKRCSRGAIDVGPSLCKPAWLLAEVTGFAC